jgi:hypothetical protein
MEFFAFTQPQSPPPDLVKSRNSAVTVSFKTNAKASFASLFITKSAIGPQLVKTQTQASAKVFFMAFVSSFAGFYLTALPV